MQADWPQVLAAGQRHAVVVAHPHDVVPAMRKAWCSMSRPVVAVVIPTIAGREDHLERCLAAYDAERGPDLRVRAIVVRDAPTCGVAWQSACESIAASPLPHPDFLHLTADDLEPAPGALLAAIEACTNGNLPAPHVLTADGLTQSAGGAGDGVLWEQSHAGRVSNWCAIPFLPWPAWRMVGPMIPLHYYTDDWFSYRCRMLGYKFRFTPDYRFTHYDAMVGRGAGMTQHERAAVDRRDFAAYIAGELTP